MGNGMSLQARQFGKVVNSLAGANPSNMIDRFARGDGSGKSGTVDGRGSRQWRGNCWGSSQRW